jgi:hypothetical protein
LILLAVHQVKQKDKKFVIVKVRWVHERVVIVIKICKIYAIVKPSKRFCNRGFYEINQQKQKDGK